jgi:hypothetical protein
MGALRRHLLALDSACAGLHRGKATGAPMTMAYYRISGAAKSPLAVSTSLLGNALPRFTHIKNRGNEIDPKDKLSGNTLGNFSAFVSPRFRANDWMWGRMDAAAGLVEILVRPEYLRRKSPNGARDDVPVVAAVEEAVLADFSSVDGHDLRNSAKAVCQQLWADNVAQVGEELIDVLTTADREPPPRTCELLTARWQLEIFLGEVEHIFGESLQPGGSTIRLPALKAVPPDSHPDPAREAARQADARENLRSVMKAYEASPRRATDIWGDRHTTALGVRIARAAAAAVVPEAGLVNWFKRMLLAAPLMLTATALLTRGAFLVASGLLINVVLAPRLATAARLVALFLAAGLSLVLLSKCVLRKTKAWRGWVAAVLAASTFAFGIGTLVARSWPWRAPRQFMSDAPWHIPGKDWQPVVGGAIVVAVAVWIASALLWNWAKARWWVGISTAASALIGAWVVLGAWVPERAKPLAPGANLLSPIGSMWVPAVALVLLTTAITMAGRPEHREA